MSKEEKIENIEIYKIQQDLEVAQNRDIRLCCYLNSMSKEQTITEKEQSLIGFAMTEVKERIYYRGLLKSLWEQILTIEKKIDTLHVYDSIENEEFTDDELTINPISIDVSNIDMNIIDLSEMVDSSSSLENKKDKASKKEKDSKKDKKSKKNKKRKEQKNHKKTVKKSKKLKKDLQ